MPGTENNQQTNELNNLNKMIHDAINLIVKLKGDAGSSQSLAAIREDLFKASKKLGFLLKQEDPFSKVSGSANYSPSANASTLPLGAGQNPAPPISNVFKVK